VNRQQKINEVIIFDFDGTIADNFLATLQLVYEAAHRQPMPDEDLSRLRGMGMFRLSRALKVPLWKIPFLVGKIRRLMRIEIRSENIVPGMDDAIKSLHKKHKLFVLSSNSVAGMREFFVRYELETCFEEIVGNANPIHKQRQMAELIDKHKLIPGHTWYVGDEGLDISAAKSAGLKMAAVSWGYNDVRLLESHEPDKLVFSPEELITLF
jgi:phosphoglycolate phosphatase